MAVNNVIINKLVVIGLGLIGGSLAAAVKKQNNASHTEVIGIARRNETCEEALKKGVVDRAYTSIESVASELGEGDVIFIAVPTLAIGQVFAEIKNVVSANVTVTDGASVKGSVMTAAREVYGEVPGQLVLAHPIAGSEQSGIAAADEDLYKDHRVILTPVEETIPTHLLRVRKLWESVGAEVLEMPVAEHDEVLAATSHLPHVIAYSLVDTLANDAENENIFRYAAGGFRDFTRMASSDPIMWHDIMKANRESILNALDLFSENLARLRGAIETEDSEHLLAVFTRAKQARDHFIHLMDKRIENKRKQKS